MIKDLFISLIAFLTVYSKKMQYDLQEKSEQRQYRLISEIEKYRSKPSTDNTMRADYLQAELTKELAKYKELSK